MPRQKNSMSYSMSTIMALHKKMMSLPYLHARDQYFVQVYLVEIEYYMQGRLERNPRSEAVMHNMPAPLEAFSFGFIFRIDVVFLHVQCGGTCSRLILGTRPDSSYPFCMSRQFPVCTEQRERNAFYARNLQLSLFLRRQLVPIVVREELFLMHSPSQP